MSDTNLSSFIWSVADLLRGDYKQSEYGKVILPFTVLRRLDCVLEATKAAVLKELERRKKAGVNPEPFLLRTAGQLFYNTSPLDLKKLMGDQDHIGENLRAYMHAFSPAVRDIFESFEFHTQIDKLAKSGLLYLVTEKFANIDLHPTAPICALLTAFGCRSMPANFSVTRYSSPALSSRSIWLWNSKRSKMSRTAGANACR